MNKDLSNTIKKLPSGESSIKKIIENNFIYVDKTKYIYNIITKNSYYFLSRPRRFGKSLLISTFIEIFSGNKELFKDCWIYKNTDYDWKKYPIIHLDFGDKKQELKKGFYDVLFNQLKKIAYSYNLIINDDNITEYFSSLIEELYKKEGQVVLLVDEYDKPILDNINNLEAANQNRNILSGIFSTAKSLSGMLRFQFITGITKFTQISLFSGPNNLKDISMSSYYQYLLGYTQEELELYFNNYLNLILNDEKININNKSELLNKIKEYYNGYLFSHEDKRLETVYNPFSILNFFEDKSFNSYWFKSGTPSFLIELLNKYIYEVPEDENNIILNISELEKFEVERINLPSLLFQAGYLIIESYNVDTDMIKLKYPNEEVRKSFKEQIKIAIQEKFKKEGSDIKLYFKNEDWEKLFELFKSLYATIPYIEDRNESWYSAMFFQAFQSNNFKCEMQSMSNIGRSDMVLYANNKVYIIEFKYNTKAKNAIQQIRTMKYFEKYLKYNYQIVLIGISFNKLERNIYEWAIEDL